MKLESPMHASAFAYKGAGCLLVGHTGAGKSRVLAEALLHGAELVSDDRVVLESTDKHLIATPAPNLTGVLELRGFGLIKQAPVTTFQIIHLVVLLEHGANERLPEPATIEYFGIDVPFMTLPPPPVLSTASLLLYLSAMQEGRTLPTDWHPLG